MNLDVELPVVNRANRPRWGANQLGGQTSQGVNKPEGESARHRGSISQGA